MDYFLVGRYTTLKECEQMLEKQFFMYSSTVTVIYNNP